MHPPLRLRAFILTMLAATVLALAGAEGATSTATAAQAGPAHAVKRLGRDHRGRRPAHHAGSAHASMTAAQPAQRPYLFGPIDAAPSARWKMTPEIPSLFPSVPGPAGRPGIALVATPSSPGPNSQSALSSRWVAPGLARAGWADGRPAEGQDTWYRVRMRFPRGRYLPTRGQWNWVVEWHDDNRSSSYPGAYSIALGVYTDYTGEAGQPGVNPRLALRLMGGDVTAPSVRTFELPPGSLRYDHWYDLVFHMVWSSDSERGRSEWWVDGQRVASTGFPTLYKLPDGTHSYNTFGVYNYRLQADWTSEVHFADVGIGPDRSSVGG